MKRNTMAVFWNQLGLIERIDRVIEDNSETDNKKMLYF